MSITAEATAQSSIVDDFATAPECYCFISLTPALPDQEDRKRDPDPQQRSTCQTDGHDRTCTDGRRRAFCIFRLGIVLIAPDTSGIDGGTIGQSEDQVALLIDLRAVDSGSNRAVLAVFSLFAVLALGGNPGVQVTQPPVPVLADLRGVADGLDLGIHIPDPTRESAVFFQRVFIWCLAGLHRLIGNNYRFSISGKARENMETVKRSSNNVIEFLQSEGYIRFKADSEASSKAIYEAYTRWCDDNAQKPMWGYVCEPDHECQINADGDSL